MAEYRDSNAVHRADGLRGLVTKATGRSSPKEQAKRIYRRPPIIQSGIAARCRKLWLIAASTLASAFLGVSEPALAQTFDSGGNPYPNGINGVPGPDGSINLTLEAGVMVNAGGNAVNAANTTNSTTPPSAPVTITANGTATNGITINNTANPSGNNLSGLRIQSSGAATITATNTNIDVDGITGSGTNNGIWAIVQGSNAPPASPVNATVTWTGDHITSSGPSNSTGIQAENRGSGNAIVDASGNISVSAGTSGGFSNFGINAKAGSTLGGGTGGPGNASVIYSSGTIKLDGSSFSDGIFATAPGSATITTSSGTSITVSQVFSSDIGQKGIEAFATSGATMVTAASTILINGNPTSPVADFRSQPSGIQLQSNLGGPASVDYTGPGITVHGGGGLGIVAVSGSSGAAAPSGSVTVNASGPIVADGPDAVGILADSGTLRNTIQNRPTTLMTGPVQVTASNVSTPGEFGTAISAKGGSGGVTVNIPSGGSIMGGWQAGKLLPLLFPTPPFFPADLLLPSRPPATSARYRVCRPLAFS